MRMVSTYFPNNHNNAWERLCTVFLYSALQQGYRVDILTPDKEDYPIDHKSGQVINNTIKLHTWVNYLNERAEGEEIIFIDCDILIVGDLYEAFSHDFDIAWTRKTKVGKLNGGVLFVRNNERTRLFFNRWLEINNQMVQDREFHKKWQVEQGYMGINQASFGYMIEREPIALLKDLPCSKYNVCDDDWRSPNSGDRLAIHYKSRLRKALFVDNEKRVQRTSNKRRHQRMLLLRRLWLDVEDKAVRAGVNINDHRYDLENSKEYV